MDRRTGGRSVLRKAKLPDEHEFCYEAEVLGVDQFGTWLVLPRGGRWSAPHDQGRLSFPCIVLLPRSGPWVAWWVDNPPTTRLQIDVARPAVSDAEGWRFVDLELDVFSDRACQEVTLVDEADLRDRVLDGTVSTGEALSVRRTAEVLIESLAERPPWVERGWELLSRA